MNDPLDDAARALRHHLERATVDADATRRRLLGSIVRRERLRKLQIGGAVVVAIVLTNSTTWALTTGRLPRALDSATSALTDFVGSFEGTGESAPERDGERIEAPPPEAAPALRAEEPEPSTDAPTAVGPEEPVRETRRTVDDGALAALDLGPVAAPPEPAIVDTRDRRSFAEAHALHFADQDTHAALAAWDAYLTEFSNGRFVPEAQWNRALCLVRLRRLPEARDALRLFADGAHGGVRQREAQSLLDVLADRR